MGKAADPRDSYSLQVRCALQVGWLKATRADLVISDTVPLACAAAKLAGVPCVCISNFSWGEPTSTASGSCPRCLQHRSALREHHALAATNSWRLPLLTLPAFGSII